MLDFIDSIGQTITNVFNFIVSTVETFKGIGQSVSEFFTMAGAVIAVLPDSVQAIIFSALALLLAFIVIELTRDYL